MSSKGNDLASLVDEKITSHPGYQAFAEYCKKELIHPYPIYFMIWQASREDLVIKLPERIDFTEKGGDYFDGARNGYNQCIDACTVSLRMVGLEVKP